MRMAIGRWCAAAITLTVLAAGNVSAWGQDDWSGESSPWTAGPPLPGELTLGAVPEDVGPDADLGRRVEELEAAMKKAADKEAEAKAKAAGKPTVSVSGRAFLDSVNFNQNAASRAALGDAQDTLFFRTARLQAEGDMFDVFSYRFEMDFSARDQGDLERTAFKDVYLKIKELPILGNVQVGHFKEPFSLEELTSNRYTTFMERALPNAFVHGRDPGLMAFNCTENERATWAVGVFRRAGDTPPLSVGDDHSLGLTARVTWLPWYDEASDGTGLIHLGAGYGFHDVDSPVQRVRARPEVAVGPQVADTGNFGGVENYQVFGPEFAFVYGPLSIQSEWIGTLYQRSGAASARFSGYYVYASYFLTGEHRVYRRSDGRFDRVRPLENFFRVRDGDCGVRTGRGAWEIAYRYSNINLDDADAAILGGMAGDHTIGLNWYLNPYMRIMWNYIHTDADTRNNGPNVPMDIFAMRAQFDF